MGEPEVTFEFYRDSWGGGLAEGDFSSALPRALAAVRGLTWPNVPDAGSEGAWRRAVCAAVDVDAAYGLTGGTAAVSSATLGSMSVTLGGGQQGSSYDADVARAVRGELVGTGLLFMGIG